MTSRLAFLLRWRPASARGRHLAAAVALLGGAVLASASIFATGPAAAPEPRTEKSWPVAVLQVMPEPRSPTFTVYGRMESGRRAALGTDVAAPVARVRVQEGDWVARDDVLVELDDAEARLQLAEREAERARQQALLRSIESEQSMLQRTLGQARSVSELAARKLARHQALLDQRLISQSLLDEAAAEANRAAIELEAHQRRLDDLPHRLAAQRADLARIEALTERARLDLDRTVLRAPFDGPVLAVHAAPGDRNRPGVVLVEMADAGALQVRTQVPDRYEARLHRYLTDGETVRAALADGQTLTLARVAHGIRPGQTGIDAFFRPDPTLPVSALPPLGRVMELRVSLPAEPDVVALPIASLYENDRVFAVEARRLRAIRVERVGEVQTAEGDYRVLVRSPELAGGRAVITTQLPRAMDGLLVEPS
ncbi:MAG: HlyD family efflux transporter periplasmic adaptor subunit [Pseudomonadales bacterium]